MSLSKQPQGYYLAEGASADGEVYQAEVSANHIVFTNQNPAKQGLDNPPIVVGMGDLNKGFVEANGLGGFIIKTGPAKAQDMATGELSH